MISARPDILPWGETTVPEGDMPMRAVTRPGLVGWDGD